MVILTIAAPSNPHTIYFDHPLRKPSHMRLVSCSIYNSWDNLKQKGEISIKPTGSTGKPTIVEIDPGYYTPTSLAETISVKFAEQNIEFLVKAHTAVSGMVILNPDRKYLIGLSNNIHTFFDVDGQIFPHIAVKRFISPTSYYIHCDLIDKEQNLLNGRPSSVLARFNIRGKSFEKVFYESQQKHL